MTLKMCWLEFKLEVVLDHRPWPRTCCLRTHYVSKPWKIRKIYLAFSSRHQKHTGQAMKVSGIARIWCKEKQARNWEKMILGWHMKVLWNSCNKQRQSYRPIYSFWIGNHRVQYQEFTAQKWPEKLNTSKMRGGTCPSVPYIWQCSWWK